MNNSRDIITDILDAGLRYIGNDAIVIGHVHYTYKDLFDRASGICQELLQTSGTPERTIFGIVAEDKIETYASILAILTSGLTYVMLHPSYPLERNQQIISQTGLKTVLHSKDTDLRLEDVSSICTSDLRSTTPLQDATPKEATTDSYAYIIFTSGSTGTPKGVPISRRNLNAFYNSYCHLPWKLDSHDRMLQMFELTFDVSVVSTLYPLTLGACIYTVGNEMAKYLKVFDLMDSEHLTFAAIAPSMLQLISPYFDDLNLPDLKYLILTAEASHLDIVERFTRCAPNAQIVNLYGPTEGTIYCTAYFLPKDTENTSSPLSAAKEHNGVIAIGQPFDDTDAIIIKDNDTATAENGTEGELCISGPQIMDGYWHDPAKTAAATFQLTEPGQKVKRYYRTGDICYKDKDGDIIYCGRKDSQVKIQGFRVELGEIEFAARKCLGGNANTVALAIQEDGVTTLYLFIEGAPRDTNELTTEMEKLLPPYMIPKVIRFMETFPTNTNNKIDRKKIKECIQ